MKIEQEIAAIRLHWREALPNDRLAHLVRDASRVFARALQARLAEHDVALGHWIFLRILWSHDGLTQRELSIEAGVMEPTTFAAVKAMETLGYVKRSQRDGNKKNIYVMLTPKGKQLEKKLVPIAEAINAQAVVGLSESDVSTVRKGLLTIVDNLTRDLE